MTTASPLADDAPHLLVVDDDRRIRDLLSRFLHGAGYRVTTATSAAEARAKLGALHFDLLILDVMMPGESGFDLAKAIRVESTVPILMLTARDEKESRIQGLEIGADDYLAKPFEPRELSLRIANILKRAQPAPAPAVELVRFGPFVFHIGRGELQRGEDMIRLTDREREMLRTLAENPGDDGAAAGARRQWRRQQRARGRRAGQPAAPQDRARSGQSADRADRARHRLPAGDHAMTSLDIGIATLRSAAGRVRRRLGSARHAGSTAFCRRGSTPARCSSSSRRW